MGIQEYIKHIETVRNKIASLPETVNQIVAGNQDVLLSLNRDQMLLGRGSDGEPFTPGYLGDPYFSTPQEAETYAKMKYKLEAKHKARVENPTIYPEKARNTPNLIVTGSFQDNMFILTEGDTFLLGSTYPDTKDIEGKYDNRVFGLAPASKKYFYTNFIHPALRKLLKEK